MSTLGVATLVSGRRAHLRHLLAGIERQSRPPDRVVVVCMDTDPVSAAGATIVRLPTCGGELPLAAARNAGVAALETDAVVLLDVDCIPAVGLVAGYAQALSGPAGSGLVCGEVGYLPPGVPANDGCAGGTEACLAAAAVPHPARPRPAGGEVVRDDRHELAWTTSLAFRRTTFDRIGGFDTRFVGYGGEDTDFAERARRARIGVWWTGDAPAYHQDHGVPAGPPVQHLDAIVRNALLFHTLHGWWPMTGWLRDFQDRGLIRFEPDLGLLERVA